MVPELMGGAGTGRYPSALRRALTMRDDIELVPLAPTRRRAHADAQRVAHGLLREGLYYPAALAAQARRADVDLVHCPSPLAAHALRRPLVMTVHDVLPLSHPELFPRVTVLHQRAFLRRAAGRAVRIITGAEQARAEIVDVLGADPARVSVTPYGVDRRFRPEPPGDAWLRSRFGIDRPYVLAVGTLEPRKNLVSALRAVATLGRDVALVIAGGQGWRNEDFERELPRAPMPVVLTGRVSDEELVSLYSAARCLVFPSLYEGYGLPPLEAMACGCPVVSTDRSTLPEVVGDAGLLVDPLDVEQIAEAIRSILDGDMIAAELRRRSLKRAGELTWERTAALTVDVYEEALAAAGLRPT